jgi:hypothetical protein
MSDRQEVFLPGRKGGTLQHRFAGIRPEVESRNGDLSCFVRPIYAMFWSCNRAGRALQLDMGGGVPMRPWSVLSLFGLIALSMIPLPAEAATVMTMGEGSECGMPPVPFGTLPQIPGASGSALGCFISTAPIFRLDLTFSAPPDPGGVSCGGAFFALCSVTETAGITDVSFTGAPGIPGSTLFEVVLTGFTPGKVVTGTANAPAAPGVPEPATGPTILLTILAVAISMVWRRWWLA